MQPKLLLFSSVSIMVISLLLVSYPQSTKSDKLIIIPESRIYSLGEIASMLSKSGIEHIVDKRFNSELIFVSAGQYKCRVLQRAIALATGLKWRRVAQIMFLTLHRDTPPTQIHEEIATALVKRMISRISLKDTPFNWDDFKPRVPTRSYRRTNFNSLPLDQQLWLATRARMLHGTFPKEEAKPMELADLKRAVVEFEIRMIFSVGHYIRVGTDNAGVPIWMTRYGNSAGASILRYPF